MQRDWQVMGYMTDEGYLYDRDEMRSALIEVEAMLYRFGGAVTVAAVRSEVAPGRFEPDGLRFRYESFMPAQRRPEPDPEPVVLEPEPELEPVPVEA